MHPYYEKKQSKLKKEMDQYLSLISGELEAETKQPYAALLEEIWQYYRDEILEKLPYVGGDASSGTKNLTGAYCFVAMGVVVRQYGVTLERWGYLSTLAYQRYFAKIPAFVKKLARKLFAKPRLVTAALKKKDAKNAANAARNPGSFETKTQPGTAEFPVIYHTVVCPLADFAAQYGYQEYMPYLCNLDYVMFASFGVPFYRTKTCAAGDGYCNFSMRAGGEIVPAWPCHSLDENDPLK